MAYLAINKLVTSVRRKFRPLRRKIDIEICKRKVRRLPPDLSLNQIVQFALSERAISAQQVPTEIMELATLVAEAKAKTIIEIGTSRGGTLFVLCRLAPPGSTIVSLDMPGAGFGEAYSAQHAQLFNLFPSKGQLLHVVTANSHDSGTRRRVESLLAGQRVDLLFIDGDHSYEGVKKDFDMYSPLVDESGIVVFHDIAEDTKFGSCEVKRFWDKIKLEFRHREIIANPHQGWAGVGVLWMDGKGNSRMSIKD